jgi:hypothetical protein
VTRVIVKAGCENNVPKASWKAGPEEGEEVDIELKGKSLFGLLKG